MTVKVRYERGMLKLLESVQLEEEKVYEIELKGEVKTTDMHFISAEKIDRLCGIAKMGGDAVADSENLYE